MCRRIGAELGSPNGVLILDGSGFPKTGPHSVGTQRQWCGRLGKEEQCQVGEFLVYAAHGSVTLADCELYLPKDWAEDLPRRKACYVPKEVEFQTGWELAAKMVLGRGQMLPHRWVVGDENYGRPTEFRDLLHQKGERYLLEVPKTAKVWLPRGGGWMRAVDWTDRLPKRAWKKFTVRDGEKGPLTVRAAKARVYTKRQKGPERPEILLVVHNDRESKSWTYLASDTRAPLREMVRVGSCRHGIEHALNLAKGDVGLDEYEMRSWIGWHHHMTLSMLALWFLVLEQRWLKKRAWRLPFHRFAECWPSPFGAIAAMGRSQSWSTSNCGALSIPGSGTGQRGTAAPHPGSKSERRWIDGTSTHATELAQFN
jgi:SRSO17 transposase